MASGRGGPVVRGWNRRGFPRTVRVGRCTGPAACAFDVQPADSPLAISSVKATLSMWPTTLRSAIRTDRLERPMATDWFVGLPASLVFVVLSTVGMYLTVLGLARWSGVRSFAQMSTFDVAVTIAIGSLLASSILSREPPLLQGMVAAASLYALQLFVSRLRCASERWRRAVDNGPILLMGRGGEMLHENMRVARITEDDLRCQLRRANVIDPTRIEAVVMEGTGNVHVLHGHDVPPGSDAWILQNVRDYSAPGRSG